MTRTPSPQLRRAAQTTAFLAALGGLVALPLAAVLSASPSFSYTAERALLASATESVVTPPAPAVTDFEAPVAFIVE